MRASPLAATLGVPLDPSGRVEVLPELSIPGHPEVFVIGDLAKQVMAGGSQVPGVGFRDRLAMMFHWAWWWLTFERSARLISGPVGALPEIHTRHAAAVEAPIALEVAAVN